MKKFKDSNKTNVICGVFMKTSERVDAIGNVDELNSLVGFTKNRISYNEIKETLKNIQADLWKMGSDLADPNNKSDIGIDANDVIKLEELIKKYEDQLEPLTNFILTFDSEGASLLDNCRVVARRCERSILKAKEKEEINNEVFRYMNRLSDLFFALARLVNKQDGKDEIKWEPNK